MPLRKPVGFSIIGGDSRLNLFPVSVIVGQSSVDLRQCQMTKLLCDLLRAEP